MNEAKDKVLTLNVCLKPSEPTAHPRATNYMRAGAGLVGATPSVANLVIA